MSGMPPETFAPAPVPPIPWEQPGTPLLKGFFETIGLFFTRPREAYRRMPTTPNLGISHTPDDTPTTAAEIVAAE